MIPLPIHPLPAKPAFGLPCNGCGLCCAAQVCAVGQIVFGLNVKGPCPALKFYGDRTACGLVEAEIKNNMEPILQRTLYIGEGCTMEDHLVEKYHINKTQDQNEDHRPAHP